MIVIFQALALFPCTTLYFGYICFGPRIMWKKYFYEYGERTHILRTTHLKILEVQWICIELLLLCWIFISRCWSNFEMWHNFCPCSLILSPVVLLNFSSDTRCKGMSITLTCLLLTQIHDNQKLRRVTFVWMWNHAIYYCQRPKNIFNTTPTYMIGLIKWNSHNLRTNTAFKACRIIVTKRFYLK